MIQDISRIFAKTKILATLGPATSSVEQIIQLMQAGLDGVRFNFSHGDYGFYEQLFKNVDDACKQVGEPLAILLDLQGPKIRIGELAEPSFEIHTGDRIEISTKKFPGTKERLSTSYSPLAKDANIGDIILIDDGLIRLRIVGKNNDAVICEIEAGGIVKPKKGMNLPGMKLSTASVTEKDFRDLEFALQYRVDYIALSFVRNGGDIIELKNWLTQRNFKKPIIAKIEKPEAVENFDLILAASDGIMVARGDLGVELNAQDVPIVQKQIIRECNCVGKLVITATQMLESMINNPIPTRAEASDVANAVWDGTDAVMLSGETSVGKFPVKTVEMMNNIVRKAEQTPAARNIIEYVIPEEKKDNTFDAFCRAIVQISSQTKAAAIVVFTHEGRTAQLISKFHPDARIIAISDNFSAMNNLCLKWGITSLFHCDISKEQDCIDEIKPLLLNSGHVQPGDLLIFTAGAPYFEQSRTNWLKFSHA